MTAQDVIGRYEKLWPGSAWHKGDDEGRAQWIQDWDGFGKFNIDAIDVASPTEISVVLAPIDGDAKARRKITFVVEADPPHRIRLENWQRVYDFDLQIREATAADAETLAEIERGAAVVLGDTHIATDRGDDYFAAARLMEDVTVFLAEIEGKPAGVAWGANAPANFLGKEQRVTYFIHLRVLPEHQRRGLWGAFDNAVWSRYWETTDLYVGYWLAENVAWSHVAKQVQARPDFVPREWVPAVYRLLLPTEAIATNRGATTVRRATDKDASHIVDVLNEFHAGEEFYLPYTEESLAGRLERDPLYSWSDVLLTDNAVLGIWPAGEQIEVVTNAAGETSRTRRGHVMDYGFLPGAEAEFRDLLGAGSAHLRDRAIDQLSIFTSKGAKGQPTLKQLDGRVEAYRFNTGVAAQIPDEAQHAGIYTDHTYF